MAKLLDDVYARIERIGARMLFIIGLVMAILALGEKMFLGSSITGWILLGGVVCAGLLACLYVRTATFGVEQPVFRFQPRSRRFAKIGMFAIPLLALSAAGYVVLASAPREDAVLIAKFASSEAGDDERRFVFDVQSMTQSSIDSILEADSITDVHSATCGIAASRAQARALGKEAHAMVVAWGVLHYGPPDGALVNVHCECLAGGLMDSIRLPQMDKWYCFKEIDSLSIRSRLSCRMRGIALFFVGLVKYGRHDYSGADKMFNHSLHQCNPSDIIDTQFVNYFRGMCAMRLQNRREAIAFFRRCAGDRYLDSLARSHRAALGDRGDTADHPRRDTVPTSSRRDTMDSSHTVEPQSKLKAVRPCIVVNKIGRDGGAPDVTPVLYVNWSYADGSRAYPVATDADIFLPKPYGNVCGGIDRGMNCLWLDQGAFFAGRYHLHNDWFSNDVTISFWMRPAGRPDTATIVQIGYDYASNRAVDQYMSVALSGGMVWCIARGPEGESFAFGPREVGDIGDIWHHVAVVKDGMNGTLTVYVDGRAGKHSDDHSGIFSRAMEASICIGGSMIPTGHARVPRTFFSGGLSDFRFYAYALSADKIEEMRRENHSVQGR